TKRRTGRSTAGTANPPPWPRHSPLTRAGPGCPRSFTWARRRPPPAGRPSSWPIFPSCSLPSERRSVLGRLELLHEDPPRFFGQLAQEGGKVAFPPVQTAGHAHHLFALVQRLAQPVERRLRAVLGLGIRVLRQHEGLVRAGHAQPHLLLVAD